MQRTHVGVILGAAVLAACASSGATRAPDMETSIEGTSTGAYVRLRDPSEAISKRVNRPAAEVWQALPLVYSRLGLGGKVLDAAHRVYGNERVVGTRVNDKPPDVYFRCGNEGSGSGAASRMRVQFRITTTVTEVSAAASEVATDIQASATPIEGTSTGPVLCASIGTLEQEILMGVGGR